MKTHGDGTFKRSDFQSIGDCVVFERGVLVFHAERIVIGDNVYIGHNTTLKGYYKNRMVVGDNTWIGQNCFFHSAGGLYISDNVGIGPGVQIITSAHEIKGKEIILHSDIVFQSVVIEAEADIGIGSIILPGVTIGKGVQVGAGSVVTKDVEPFTVVAGSPAKKIRDRGDRNE